MRRAEGYRDSVGRVFIVSDGISRASEWRVFEVRRTGSLRRVKSIPMTANRQAAIAALEAWAAKKRMTPATVERP